MFLRCSDWTAPQRDPNPRHACLRRFCRLCRAHLDRRPFLSFLHRLTAKSQNFLWISQLRETIQRRPNGVEWIPASQGLCNDIVSPHQLDHRAHRAPANNARSIDRRLEQDMFAAEEAMDLMRNGTTLERDVNQVLLGLLDRFRNGDRDLGSFSLADTHPAMPVAHHHQGAEVKALTAFDNLRDPVDEDDLVFQA